MIAVFGSVGVALAVAALMTLPEWWGFWRPDRRAARRYEDHRRRRIAALVALGLPPARAEREADAQLAREADDTVRLLHEAAP
jgi:hypothetical protein